MVSESDGSPARGADGTSGECEPPTRCGESLDRNDATGPTADGTDAVEARLEDALERVAHGATVSVPAILLQRGLALAFTAVLTNGFAASAYGAFALARRLQRYLRRLALGFRSGLSRFLPNAESAAERDALATFAALLLVGVSVAFGAALFAAAPLATEVAGEGPQFQLLLRVFALGLPAGVWLFTVTEVLRGLEAVGPLNLALRVGFPTAQLIAGAVATYVLQDLVLAAVGVVLATGAVGVAAAVWVARERGFRPRLRGAEARRLRRKYLRFTLPLFVGGFATTTQRLGFYPLIAVFLSSVAGGVFAVGVLLGTLVRLPLMGINQFIPPVAAALNEEGHREALQRLYHVTSRLVLIGVTGLAVPVIVYRESVMGLFGPTYVQYAPLLPGFILAQYAACAAGSVGILLTMTDHQRALLVVNVAITTGLAIIAVPLTSQFGLTGLVVSYVLMLTVNNGLEVAVLYRLEGLQPFTRRHARPLVAAVPLAAVALGVRFAVPGVAAPVLGTAGGLAAYAKTLQALGFTRVERRLGATLVRRYRESLSRDWASAFG
ncbi:MULTISPECIES: lipopolysaccharide biosynthesis protein [Halorussus]|uniref:lipopolysaccharide biosynthesis protein n=1 Tax=Halorussus TaxID=1070314 RepID=UPI000E20D3FA|nr:MULTISPECIES: lipopolysaccharide biosynthesis protein [Halorussus]NHN59115.1 lipopolysaccharide biosynthesis protein [Halorussus sp. JP-T4]